ncbi:MAG TPA: thiosulfate oxidation carrier protein SoxY [Methylomirabilota bacterium]|nr:thiosulfate oxidation carrier protein SoxY [Methylomirabilota bacterium]
MRHGEGMTRRRLIGTLGALGVAGATGAVSLARPAPAAAQPVQPLGAQESVHDALERVFGSRRMKDGTGTVKLDVPLIAENGAVVPVTVEAASPMTPANHVKRVYVVADKNRIPIIARATLFPESGQAFVAANVRLGETGDVRAIVEQSDGTLLQVKREVKVTVGGCGG